MPNINPIILAGGTSAEWVRPSDWLAMPSAPAQGFVGLFAVVPNSTNPIAFIANTSTGSYYVDWGDGTNSTLASGSLASKTYDYTTYDVGDSTLNSAGQKQVLVTVTPLTGNLTSMNFQQRISPFNTAYTVNLLDGILQLPNATASGITLGGTTVLYTLCERFNILSIGGVTSLASLFNGFRSLRNVSLPSTSSVTNMSSMFALCHSLRTFPTLTTSSVTNMSSMFSGCNRLEAGPTLTTTAVTNMSSMFLNCTRLKTIPTYGTSLVTNMSNMFSGCDSFVEVPLLSTAAVTNMSGMFNGCTSLKYIPAFTAPGITVSAGTAYNSTFATSASSLEKVDMVFTKTVGFSNSMLSETELNKILNNLAAQNTGASATITLTGNYGLGTIVTLNGTTTTGSTTITMVNTTGIVAGMQVTGIGTATNNPFSCTMQDVGDTITLNNHGLPSGTEVSFSAISGGSGLSLNTIYYVVNPTTNTFQVAATIGGAALSFTHNSSSAIRYKTEVVSIVPNTSVTVSTPLVASGTNGLTFRTLRTDTALLKGWTVTG